jgi:hypothetical protein
MKTELQESNAVFQKQLSDYESTLSTLHEKANWIMQNHATTKDHDTIKLTEAVKQAKARYGDRTCILVRQLSIHRSPCVCIHIYD